MDRDPPNFSDISDGLVQIFFSGTDTTSEEVSGRRCVHGRPLATSPRIRPPCLSPRRSIFRGLANAFILLSYRALEQPYLEVSKTMNLIVRLPLSVGIPKHSQTRFSLGRELEAKKAKRKPCFIFSNINSNTERGIASKYRNTRLH